MLKVLGLVRTLSLNSSVSRPSRIGRGHWAILSSVTLLKVRSTRSTAEPISSRFQHSSAYWLSSGTHTRMQKEKGCDARLLYRLADSKRAWLKHASSHLHLWIYLSTASPLVGSENRGKLSLRQEKREGGENIMLFMRKTSVDSERKRGRKKKKRQHI